MASTQDLAESIARHRMKTRHLRQQQEWRHANVKHVGIVCFQGKYALAILCDEDSHHEVYESFDAALGALNDWAYPEDAL